MICGGAEVVMVVLGSHCKYRYFASSLTGPHLLLSGPGDWGPLLYSVTP